LRRPSWRNIFIWTEAIGRSSTGCGVTVNKVMLPGVSVLERFVGRIRDRAQKRLWKREIAQTSQSGLLIGGFSVLDELLEQGFAPLIERQCVLFKDKLGHVAQQKCGIVAIADPDAVRHSGSARFRLARWLYALCWSGDDHPGPLVERATSWLIASGVRVRRFATVRLGLAQTGRSVTPRNHPILRPIRIIYGLSDGVSDDIWG
jgi:hypothetical protein